MVRAVAHTVVGDCISLTAGDDRICTRIRVIGIALTPAASGNEPPEWLGVMPLNAADVGLCTRALTVAMRIARVNSGRADQRIGSRRCARDGDSTPGEAGNESNEPFVHGRISPQ